MVDGDGGQADSVCRTLGSASTTELDTSINGGATAIAAGARTGVAMEIGSVAGAAVSAGDSGGGTDNTGESVGAASTDMLVAVCCTWSRTSRRRNLLRCNTT